MSVILQKKYITAEEFETYPEDCRYDLIEGELVPMPPMPGANHGATTYSLGFEVGFFVRSNDLGICFTAETRFTIEYNPDTSIGPDFAFVAKDRLTLPLPDVFLRLAPDLVLEVPSPSDRKTKVEAKMQRWIRAGVRLGWELDIEREVLTVYRPDREPRTVDIYGTIEGEDVLPGFTLPMRRLFPENR